MLALPPLTLYVHIPWCIRKCPYCDFNSHQHSGELPETAYLDALLKDLDQDLPYVQGRSLQSIFIGGGTPSLLTPATIERLLSGIRQRLPMANQCEITLEANPGTVEAGRFAEFRKCGINRLSLGIQSFDDSKLKVLGRVHDSAQAQRAINIAGAAGFDNVNLDLMYGLPGQSAAQAAEDLQQALSCAPGHLSWYQLTIEPNTQFYSRPPELPGEDQLHEIQELGLSLLSEAGLERYEISAFSRPGQEARHNINYWEFGDYLGIGAGAHGKITLPQDQKILRTRKLRQPDHYLQAGLTYTAESQSVAADEITLEYMLNALRLVRGFRASDYEARTGLAFSAIRKKLEYLRTNDWLQLIDVNNGETRSAPDATNLRENLKIVPTSKGLLFTNTLLEEFL